MSTENLFDKRLINLGTRFKCNILYTNLDFVITQINYRFQGVKMLNDNIICLPPKFIMIATDDDKRALVLTDFHKNDLSIFFPEQLLSFKTTLKFDNLKPINLLLIDN